MVTLLICTPGPMKNCIFLRTELSSKSGSIQFVSVLRSIEYFQHIHSLVLKSFNAYTERMEVVNRSIERLNTGITQLREDFDSNTNVVYKC